MQTIDSPERARSEARADRRREEILAVAAARFAAGGFSGTDVQVIADDLGVGKGTIYRYFPTKEGLFLAAVDRGMNRMQLTIDSAVSRVEDPLHKVAHAIHAFLSFFDENPDVLELLIQERAEFRDRKKPTYVEHFEKNVKPWTDRLEALSRKGRIRRLPVEGITETISNLLYGTLFTSRFSARRLSLALRSREILEIVLGGILSDMELAHLKDYISPVGMDSCDRDSNKRADPGLRSGAVAPPPETDGNHIARTRSCG